MNGEKKDGKHRLRWTNKGSTKKKRNRRQCCWLLLLLRICTSKTPPVIECSPIEQDEWRIAMQATDQNVFHVLAVLMEANTALRYKKSERILKGEAKKGNKVNGKLSKGATTNKIDNSVKRCWKGTSVMGTRKKGIQRIELDLKERRMFVLWWGKATKRVQRTVYNGEKEREKWIA